MDSKGRKSVVSTKGNGIRVEKLVSDMPYNTEKLYEARQNEREARARYNYSAGKEVRFSDPITGELKTNPDGSPSTGTIIGIGDGVVRIDTHDPSLSDPVMVVSYTDLDAGKWLVPNRDGAEIKMPEGGAYSFTVDHGDGRRETVTVEGVNGDGTAIASLRDKDGNFKGRETMTRAMIEWLEERKVQDTQEQEQQQPVTTEERQPQAREQDAGQQDATRQEPSKSGGVAGGHNMGDTFAFTDEDGDNYVVEITAANPDGTFDVSFTQTNGTHRMTRQSVTADALDAMKRLTAGNSPSPIGAQAKEADTRQENLKPVGKGRFGNIYQWTTGKAKEAADFLRRMQSGYLKGVFHRNDIGDIDLVWGNDKGGLKHIIQKHIVEHDDFDSVEEAMQIIDDVLANGEPIPQGSNLSFDYNGYRVSVAKSEDGNWVLTAFDKSRTENEKKRNSQQPLVLSLSTTDTSDGAAQGVSAQTAGISTNKDTQSSQTTQDPVQEIADGTVSLMGSVQAAQKAMAHTVAEAQKKLAEVDRKIEAAEVVLTDPKSVKRYKGLQAQAQQLRQTIDSYTAAMERLAQPQAQPTGDTGTQEDATPEDVRSVPLYTEEDPKQGRTRGWRKTVSDIVRRPERVAAAKGGTTRVKFSTDTEQEGVHAVIEADELQPSHRQGVKNPYHFLDEAQPKDREGKDSVAASRKIAAGINPQEITGGVTAYTGSPSVNARGEVVQGNNRADALIYMYANEPEAAARYKQYLVEHADEFGLDAEKVASMSKPVLVNMLDVPDDRAIELGQLTSSDLESGGTQPISPSNVANQLASKGLADRYAGMLLRGEEDESISELVVRNGREALVFLRNVAGVINDTQYRGALREDGELTPEARVALADILTMQLLGGNKALRTMFGKLPAKAQKAIMATAYRDSQSNEADRMQDEIRASIIAFNSLMEDADFAKATNYEDARRAMEAAKRQMSWDFAANTQAALMQRFSNFALTLAAMYKGSTQRQIQATFNDIYNYVQGTGQMGLFDAEAPRPHSLEEAIRHVLGLDYQPINKQYYGNTRSDNVGGNSPQGEAGGQGSPRDVAIGEQGEAGERPADGGRGTDEDGRTVSPTPTFLDAVRTIYSKGKETGNSALFRIGNEVATAEERSIMDAASRNGTYMKAPNGKPTNLTQKQWVQVRTKAFKQWFGDWEKANLYERATIAWNDSNSKGKVVVGLSEKAKRRFNQLLGTDTKQFVITDDAIRHIKNKHSEKEELRGQKNLTPEDIVVIPYLVNNYDSMELNPQKNDNKGNRAIEIRKRINGISVVATIEKGWNKEFLVTSYQFIKSDALDASLETPGPNVRNDSDIANVQKEIETIKQSAKNSSKVVDENGEPLVVYHGTTNDRETRTWNDKTKSYDTTHEPFTVFSRKPNGEKNAGFFFNSDADNAYGYGYNTYDVFLNMRNPYIIDAKGQSYSDINHNGKTHDSYDWANLAEKSGHDGLILNNVSDGVDFGALQTATTDYVVFSPTQIKSATDNTGEFSTENDDIRFRIGPDSETSMTENQRAAFDAVSSMLENAGIEVEYVSEARLQELSELSGAKLEAKRKSEARRKRDEQNHAIDHVTSLITGLTEKEARQERLRWEQHHRDLAKEIYDAVLQGNFNDVTLQKINKYIDESTPKNPFGRRISQRVPQEMERSLHEGTRTNAVDALFTRISESAVGDAGTKLARNRSEREGAKEIKKGLLKGWAIATGNWHTGIHDFTNDSEPVAQGKDSTVYKSKDGRHVIKFSKGKNDKRFSTDIDAPNLFSFVFPNTAYEILGYGEINGDFVTILRQPVVDIERPLTEQERVDYMRSLGFEPMNKENTTFTNGNLVVSDLQRGNIVFSKKGNIAVLDADVKLYTKDIGGAYIYPPAATDTEQRIDSEQPKSQRDGNSVIYGAAYNGKIYLNGEHLNPESPIHEYTHIWDAACQMNNPELWKRGVELMKQTPLWEEVEKDPNYDNLTTDDVIASEVHSRLTGKDGAALLERMAEEMTDGKRTVKEAVDALSVVGRLKKWLSDFWYWLKDTMTPWTRGEAEKVSLEDFVNMPLKDLARGTDLRTDGGTEILFRIAEEEAEKTTNELREAADNATYDNAVGDSILPEPPQPKNGMTASEFLKTWQQWKKEAIKADKALVEGYVKEMASNMRWWRRFNKDVADFARPLENLHLWIKNNGGKINIDNDAYTDLFSSAGRATYKATRFEEGLFNPLKKTITDMCRNISLKQWAKNLKIEVNVLGMPEQVQAKPYDMVTLYLRAKDMLEAEALGMVDRGAQGFMETTGMAASDFVADFEKIFTEKEIDNLWKRINGCTDFTLRTYLDEGMMTQDEYDKYSNRRFYVPQRGWAEGHDTYEYGNGKQGGRFNNPLKKAEGRNSLAADPLPYIESMAKSAIKETEKNAVKRKFLRFVRDNISLGIIYNSRN